MRLVTIEQDRKKLDRYLATYPIEDLVGKKYNQLTVTSFDKLVITKSGFQKRWNCICDCGKTRVAKETDLKRNAVRTCGHKRLQDKHWNWKGEIKIGRQKWNSICHMADMRGFAVTVTPDFLWDLYEKQNRKCAISGIPILLGLGKYKVRHTASLDRIDSKKPYSEDNVQWVHKNINVGKNKLSDHQFIWLCKQVAEFQNAKLQPSS